MMSLFLQAYPSDWVLFFGRFHPLIVHLPIGFLLIAGILELGRRLGKLQFSNGTMSTILFGSAVSATLACVFGYMLSLGGGYDREILDEHMWQGIGVAVFAWIAWVATSNFVLKRLSFGGVLYMPALGLSLVALLVAGHHGGALTHGSDYLTQYTPEPFRTLAGLPPRAASVAFKAKPITDVNQALVYEQIVNPILQTRCVQCHNAEKSKGDLRMDVPDQLAKGGENGPVFVAGKGADSEMIKRCLLDEDDEHHMPPKGKTPLTEQQVTLLTWWIDHGASFDKKVADLAVTETVKPVLASLGQATGGTIGSSGNMLADAKPAGPAPLSPVLTMNVPAADPTVIDALKKTGLLVLPLSKVNNQLEVSAVNVRTLTDAQVAELVKLSSQIVWLKLGDTQLTDAALTSIARLKNLQKLHLERTRITDAGLKRLTGLPYLEYLNLYGTQITDVGLTSLAELKALRSVYVWQTKVTESGIIALKKALPNVEVVGGMSENGVAVVR